MTIKHTVITLLLIITTSALCNGQIVQTFQPGPNNCFDAKIDDLYPNGQFGGDEFGAVAWTCSGSPCNVRSLIRFDLSSIPFNANLVGAFLSLYAHQNQTIGNINNGPTYGTANQSLLSQVLVPWTPSSITWNTQPPVSPINYVLIPQSSTANQNYINIDVTNLCQVGVSNPSSNFGWMLHLQNETAYNGLIFGSGEYPDSAMRPKLIVIYNLPSGISNNTNNIAVKASYNSLNNLALFEFENPLNEIVTFTLYDITGKIFFSKSTTDKAIVYHNESIIKGICLYHISFSKTNGIAKGKILLN